MFPSNSEEKEDLPPLSNVPISNVGDDNYMNIDLFSINQILLFLLILIFIVFLPLILTFFFPKRITVKTLSIDTHQNPYEDTQNYSFFITNQNFFNDFYSISCRFFSESNLSFNLAIEDIYRGSFKRTQSKTFEICSNETQRLYSAFFDKTKNIKFTIDFLYGDLLIENPVIMHIFCEISSASSMKFHIFIQLISALFVFFFGHLYDISIEKSGFICPEQFVTQLFIYLFVIFNVPVNLLRNFFPIQLLRIIDELFQCLQKASILIANVWLLYLKIPYQNRNVANVIAIISGISITVFIIFTTIQILYTNVNDYCTYFNESNYFSYNLLIFAVFATCLSSFLTYKNRSETDFIVQTKIYCIVSLITSSLLIFTQFLYIFEKNFSSYDLNFPSFHFLSIAFVCFLSILHFPLKRKHRLSLKKNRRKISNEKLRSEHQPLRNQPDDVSLLS